MTQLGSSEALDAAMAHADGGGSSIAFDLGGNRTLPLLRLSNDADGPLLAVVPLGLDGFDRIEAVIQLLSRLHRRVVPADTRLTRQQRQRQRRMLQAYDGYCAGATQQEIARVVLRVGDFTREEWQASSARYAVSALLRDARALIAGGYRTLLRHRRRR